MLWVCPQEEKWVGIPRTRTEGGARGPSPCERPVQQSPNMREELEGESDRAVRSVRHMRRIPGDPKSPEKPFKESDKLRCLI